MTQPTLILRDIRKRFADHVAVESLSLDVPSGTIYGILGPNGAGKSTTLRMTMNIIARDAGDVSLLGRDPARSPQVLREVGYLPEDRGLYRKMRVIDAIVFFAELKGVAPAEARARGGDWLERMGLGEWRDAKIETLSKGMQQKVQFITTVLHDPRLLILDEPFSGLDPVNQEVLRETVREAKDEGRTVIFSTHIMEQAERICDHVCIIAGGRKVLEGGLREIRRREAGDRYEIQFESPSAEFERLAQDPRWFARADRHDEGWEVELARGADPRALLTELNSLEPRLRRFLRMEPSLHEIFVSRVGDASIAHRRAGVSDA
ncbi:MAG: ATP-binding cassette domain-containing protein [Gemmatimonadota bacterium]